MRVVTYNVAGGRSGFGDLDRVALALRELRPQVVACQEWLEPSGDDRAAARADQLAAALGMHVVFAGNHDSARGLLGNALLSELPIERHENVDVSQPRREPRGVLRAGLAIGIELLNVHLGLGRGERQQQWLRLLAAAGDDSTPTIVCGDFNDVSGRIDRQARRAGFVNAVADQPRRARRTFPARWPLIAIDRIYFRSVALQSATVLRGAPWTELSDHLPVVADFDDPAPRGPREPT